MNNDIESLSLRLMMQAMELYKQQKALANATFELMQQLEQLTGGTTLSPQSITVLPQEQSRRKATLIRIK
jgi:hypothetical protein